MFVYNRYLLTSMEHGKTKLSPQNSKMRKTINVRIWRLSIGRNAGIFTADSLVCFVTISHQIEIAVFFSIPFDPFHSFCVLISELVEP